MNYTIAILDRENHNVESNILWFPETIGGVKKMLSVFMDETRPANAAQSARLSRLVKRLLMYFPLESNSEENSLWNGINPIHTVRDLPSQAWTIQIDSDQSDAFLRRLLPLARELRLDVFDLETETYYCHDMLRSYVIPEEKTAMWYELDPIAANPVKYTKAKVAKRFAEQLTPALAEYGFVPVREKLDDGFLFYVQREIEGGSQVVWASCSGSAGELRCQMYFEIYSLRASGFIQKFQQWRENQPLNDFACKKIRISLSELETLRSLTHRKILNNIDLCRSTEEIDWMIEDTLNMGIFILNKARTIQGLNWLQSNKEAKGVYPNNYYNTKKQSFSFFLYARLAGDPHFEQMAQEILEVVNSKEPIPNAPTTINEIITFCREYVSPVGDGPA
ncbi:hypothetical protein R6242_20605 [Iodobacter sp. CM08]|uniref:hypothetical protein n=1 Tax=Iodobacter sp. CM08 TaxID=3085902 RepID=UPI002981F066|nr:hypothetical protein [Iodobacter sp. CM08]MDW5418977.1 hypothetical protein [Iodobacter sp. CM08]